MKGKRIGAKLWVMVTGSREVSREGGNCEGKEGWMD